MDDDSLRSAARERLAAFLPRALADAVLDESERQELLGMLTSGVLTQDDVQGAFRGFLEGLRREILADGVFTPEERERCRAIVKALRIPDNFLSPDLAAILAE
jgi:hypothetical protein